jgi:ABC-type cobalamin/Fe3+-siderophores transport system ATPase subunit
MTMLDGHELRHEASIEPDPVHTGPVTKETQIIAIYGKGGSGKSFALSNLSYMMAQQGKRVLLIGCDPKSDTTSLLFGGKSCPTIIETSARKKLAGEEVSIEDVCFQRDGVFAMELGQRLVAVAADAGLSTALNCLRNWVFMSGALIMSCSISSAMLSAAASACRLRAICARR